MAMPSSNGQLRPWQRRAASNGYWYPVSVVINPHLLGARWRQCHRRANVKKGDASISHATQGLRSNLAIPRRTFLLSAASVLAMGRSRPALSASDVAQRVFSADDFLDSVGVGLHLHNRQTPYYSKFDRIVDLLNNIGIRHLRDDAIFASNVTRDRDFYKRVRLLVGMGYRFDLVCADALNPFMYVPPRKVSEIYDWCDCGVEMFEGANEPVLTRNPGKDPAISADCQRALYAAVKGDPKLRELIVASPSYIMENVDIAENLSDAVDWINLHPYPGMEHPETRGPGALKGFVVKAERLFGAKPVLVSETGYHTAVRTAKPHLPVSEEIKTRYLPRLLLWNFINGVKRSYIYELIDSFNKDLTDVESHFGLADFEGNPKPSFWAVKQLLALLKRPGTTGREGKTPQFTFTGNQKDLNTAAFRRADGSYIIFVWLGVSGWDPRARSSKAPVKRTMTVALDREPRAISCRRFQDDGSVAAMPIERLPGAFQITASDQLTAMEVTI